jgi:hypothetical protein
MRLLQVGGPQGGGHEDAAAGRGVLSLCSATKALSLFLFTEL